MWRGEIRIESDYVVPRGGRLVIEPGTTVRFAFRDDDGDGWGDASIRVEGELASRGTPDAPVVFTDDRGFAEPGRWGEIRVDFGSFEFKHTVIEGSTRGIHAHFSTGLVRDSVFRRNVDGTRFGESAVTVERCLFYGHPGKAFNARKCRNRVVANVFRHNQNGVFLFEADGGSSFEGNRFRENSNPFRLGDFFEGTVTTGPNDWGGQPPILLEPDVDGAGRRLEFAQGPAPDAGPRGWPWWVEDGRPPGHGPTAGPWLPANDSGERQALLDGVLYEADEAGSVRALEVLGGRTLWRRKLDGAVRSKAVDAVPGGLAVSTAAGRVYLLDRGTGLERDCWDTGTPGAPRTAWSDGRLLVETREGAVRALAVRLQGVE